MLETKELVKVYQPKKGVAVTAIDHVSLRFPEKGMVFLLGKSGSGKSTMLNLLGGLDKYDDGEIIIKGISSRDFNQQRFDSYRNTYVGFIFQEYNVLEEFTVGANVALALELQSKTATDEEINRILHDVDLDGFGDRKPNELSGGQKQRVAIARALVKNPEIIMADEPTGALDSATGRQVLDTLKKLSAEKLVIVVSHDREYAEQYADRIIELADGRVIRDVEWIPEENTAAEQEKKLIYRSTTIEIPAGYHLTEEDRLQINEYLDKLKSGATVALPDEMRGFRPTDETRIPQQDGSKFNLIRSKLPLKSAFKIGCSSLKHKRFRLVMTILLSVAAFSMFAVVDTFGSYNHIRSCTDSLIDSNLDYVSVSKSHKFNPGTLDEYWASYGYKLTAADLEEVQKETGVPMIGMYTPLDCALDFDTQYDASAFDTKTEFSSKMDRFSGYVEVTEETLKNMGYSLTAGTLPDGNKDEIAISMSAYETFLKGGYTPLKIDADGTVQYADSKMETISSPDGSKREERKINYTKINSPQDMVGKTLMLDNINYTVTGVVDTKLDLSRYELLDKEEVGNNTNIILQYILYSELQTALEDSMTGCAMVGAGKVEKMIANAPKVFELSDSNLSLYSYDSQTDANYDLWANTITSLSRIPASDIIWTNGKKDSLAENEFIISLSNLQKWDPDNGQTEFMPEDEKITTAYAKSIADELEKSELSGHFYKFNDDSDKELGTVKIVGVVAANSPYEGSTVCADSLFNLAIDNPDGLYRDAIGAMPEGRANVEKFVKYCYRDGKDIVERYSLNNAVTYELDNINEILNVLSKVFFWIGVGFAVFASLLMANFISISINYKRQEIGILRAIGSRSNDVFRIFFSESFVIAMIEFVLSAILCGVGITIFNALLRKNCGILVTVLHFGIRQVVLLFVISIAVAWIASFLPVRRIAAKKPIDAIRGR